MSEKKTLAQVQQEKNDRIMDGVGMWTAYYRANPQRFAADFLNMQLKVFQKILLYIMNLMTVMSFFASRGLGKTYIVALYCVIRCILYPGTKVCVASGVRSQATEIIGKINDDFLKLHGWGSENLRNEIKEISMSINNPHVDFKNGSFIKCVTASDNALGNRATILIVDECKLVPRDIIQRVLRPFLTSLRQPPYLNLPEYKNNPKYQERNTEIYITSAYYKSSWTYDKCKSDASMMLDDTKKYFCCGLPYQIGIKDGIYSKEAVEDEMAESDFNPITFMMEREALFYGEAENAFFAFDSLVERRVIKNAFLPLQMYEKRGINVPDLVDGERRILSVDVALMSSKTHNNDASAFAINVATPTNNGYASHIVYMQTFEGKTTDEIGITIMRYFNHYKCTDLVLDAQSFGTSVYDFICQQQFDAETGETYDAMCSCNDQLMAERCKDKSAIKCVWCIKAYEQFNSEAAAMLRAGIQTGNLSLLINEYDAEDVVKKISGYANMTPQEQASLLMPYAQTTALINEMVNLEGEVVGNKIRLREHAGMRKDRFSSVEYNYYVAQLIGREASRKNDETTKSLLDLIGGSIRKSSIIK
jgi:hypothetical protein